MTGLKELEDLRNEFHEVSRTHVTWTTYWAITILMISLTTGAVSFILREKSNTHDKFEDRITKLESGDSGYDRRITILEERYNTIVSGINDLKLILKEHDKSLR